MPLGCALSLVLSAMAASDLESIPAQLDELLGAEALAGSRAAVYVKRLDDGRELYTRDADRLLIPASNMKIVSSAATLYYFGADYRFLTEVRRSTSGPEHTRDLVVKGYGDPSLVPERLWYLASRVYYSGTREVGDIVVDDGYFPGPIAAKGFEQDRTDNAYMAPMGAVSVGFNAILVHVLPGSVAGAAARVLVDPASNYPVIQSSATTTTRGRTYLNVEVSPAGHRSRIRVSGRIHITDAGRAYWRRIDNPAVFAGEVFKSMLEQFGIKVRGKVRVGQVPEPTERVTAVTSPRLAEIVGGLNKNSNNFMAEQLALALGAARFGAPGTSEKAHDAIERFLTLDVGLDPKTYEIGNASGLHDVNRLSPRQIVAVLEFMHGNPQLAPEFVTSLAVAGASGTLADRMRETEAAHLLRAKTGTLASASALSGYVTTRSGETLAFSILVNDYRSSISEIWQVQDQIGARLAGLRLTPGLDRVATSPHSDTVGVAAP